MNTPALEHFSPSQSSFSLIDYNFIGRQPFCNGMSGQFNCDNCLIVIAIADWGRLYLQDYVGYTYLLDFHVL